MPKLTGVGAATSVGAATVTLRAYYSSYHLWAAKHFAQLADGIEAAHSGGPRFDIEHRTLITSSVLSSVAFLDAAVNELFQDAADGHESYIAPLSSAAREALAAFWEIAEERRLATLDKYQMGLVVTGHRRMEKGKQPFQDAALLVRVRNELVHYHPQSLKSDEPEDLAKKLRSKFPLNRLMEQTGNPFFPDKCLGSGCALWGVQSSATFADAFFGTLGLQPNYQRVSF